MDHGYLILCRLYTRRDDVSVQLIDSRYYHEFGQPYILRDFETRDATMEDLKKAAIVGRPFTPSLSPESRVDLRLLTSPDYVYDVLYPCIRIRERILITLRSS